MRLLQRMMSWFLWESILLTDDINLYTRTKGQLIDKGIVHKTKTRSGRTMYSQCAGVGRSSRTMYELFVKKV